MIDNRRRRGVALLALGLAAVTAVGGCGSGDSGSSESAADRAAEAPAAAPDQGGTKQGGTEGGNGDDAARRGGTAGADLRVDQRAIIYNGSITIQVKDVDQAAREATALATAAGGFVGGDRRRTVDSDARAELELRVPAAKFTGTVDEIAKLGRQQRREIRTEDVTEETIDLDARIVTQRARVENARRLLARASSISDLVSLENELGRREADLASLEAKKRRLADLTALSTLDVTLVGPDARPVDTEEENGFLTGLTSSWRVFLDSVTVLVTLLGALLPWLIVLGVPGVLLWRLLRSRRRQRPAPVAPGRPVPAPRVPMPAGVGALPTAVPGVPHGAPGAPPAAPGSPQGAPGAPPAAPKSPSASPVEPPAGPGVSGSRPPAPGAPSAP